MRASLLAPLLALTTAVAPALASAQTATQTVTFAVNAINQISATGSPSLTVTTATAGSQPTDATDASSSWAVTTNQTGAKISASIPTAMPAGLTLSVNLLAPAGASSAGLTALGTVAVDLVTSITKVAQSGMTSTYHLSATAAAGVVGSATKVVTYTISGGT
jgi:hypothetical protein